MKQSKLYIYSFILLSFQNVFAQTPKYSNEFMSIGVDARAFGMSKSVVSSVSDVTAGYWNPAGLTKIENNIQIGGMHTSYFAGLAGYNYGAASYRLDNSSVIALSMIRFAVDDIPNTTQLVDATGNINYNRITSFSVSDYGFLVSFAKKAPNVKGLSMGGNAKVIYRQAGTFAKAWGFGIDAGIQYEYNAWKFGAMARDVTSTFNAWTFNTTEFNDVLIATGNEIPKNSLEVTLPRLSLGASRKQEISDKFSILGELNIDATFDGKRNVLISASPLSIDPHIGIEAGYLDMVFLRFGIGQFQQVLSDNGKTKSYIFQPNLGIGVMINNLAIDYAITDVGDFASGLYTNVVSLKIGLNNK